MNESDLKLIDDAVNNKLDAECLLTFNKKMKDKPFRTMYLNYILDDNLIATKLEELREPELGEGSQDLSKIYDALNGKIAESESNLFNESMKDEEFRGDYLNFILDEKLLEQTLEKQIITSSTTKPRKLKLISTAMLAVAAVIIVFFFVSFEDGIVEIDRVHQAWILEGGKEIPIKRNTNLRAGDVIKVKGSLTIIYPDETQITINDNSEVILGNFNESLESRFELVKGYLTVNTHEAGRRTAEIKTKESRAVFADSTFTLSLINNLSTVEVHRGEVSFYNNLGSNGLVVAGQQAWIKEDREVSIKTVYIDNENSKYTF